MDWTHLQNFPYFCYQMPPYTPFYSNMSSNFQNFNFSSQLAYDPVNIVQKQYASPNCIKPDIVTKEKDDLSGQLKNNATKKSKKNMTFNKRQKNLNIRNIIPNLARKILSYLCSEESRKHLKKYYPDMTPQEIEQFYVFANSRKNSLSFYIGNKDLMRIWYSKDSPSHLLSMIRVLSKNFLNNECINSILLSRRMKPALKIQHLHYRRKILRILNDKRNRDD